MLNLQPSLTKSGGVDIPKIGNGITLVAVPREKKKQTEFVGLGPGPPSYDPIMEEKSVPFEGGLDHKRSAARWKGGGTEIVEKFKGMTDSRSTPQIRPI